MKTPDYNYRILGTKFHGQYYPPIARELELRDNIKPTHVKGETPIKTQVKTYRFRLATFEQFKVWVPASVSPKKEMAYLLKLALRSMK